MSTGWFSTLTPMRSCSLLTVSKCLSIDSVSQERGSLTSCYWIRVGSIVVVSGWCTVGGAKTVRLGTLPASCKPGTYFATPTASGGYAEFRTDCAVNVVAKPGANYFTGCYPIA